MTTKREMQAVAQAAAKEAIKEFLLALGVDASKPEAVLAMQQDFQHLRGSREAYETVKRHSLKTAVGIVVTAFLGFVLLFFGLKAGAPPPG